MAKKVTPKFRAYDVVSRAVEEGVATGLRRAYKHQTWEPPAAELERLQTELEQAVLLALCEVLKLDEDW